MDETLTISADETSTDSADRPSLPDRVRRIEALELEILEISEKVEALREETSAIKDDVTDKILSTHTSDGKPVYSNEQKRKTAISTVLSRHNTYQRLVEELAAAESRRSRLQIARDSAHRLYQIAKIDYEAEMLGRRNAAT